ncbi:MAG: TIGR03560 family F420-dependent LLM class oxidoreductase [Candidatus Heimdallarchaeota archaeon]|nr:TIGR03560 family F420-dependent LLM class oxidoreductase [Candidatus Heimdallarchaeota archaeon]
MITKFGIQIEPQFGFDYKTVEKIALYAEKVGYDSIWSSDHLFLNDKSEGINCMEAWSLLSALAVVTKKLKLGTLVTCNSYRFPSILAKIVATVDMISEGRVFFGFGAGWKEIEYNAYGIPFPSVKERLEQLEEAIDLIKLLWTEPKVTYEGKYYQIKDAFSAPKPIQKPYPPIMIGGMGEKVLLKIVAKHADWCNFFPRPNIKHSLEVLKEHCIAVGRDFSDVRKSLFVVGVPIYVSESDEEINQFMGELAKRHNRTIEQIREHYSSGFPGSWAGKPEEVIERFQHFIDMGFEYFQVLFNGFDEKIVDYSKDFAEMVMKKL